MQSYIEHANITVANLDRGVEFLTTAMPDFQIRKRFHHNGQEWAHVGTDSTYVALVEATAGELARLGKNPSTTSPGPLGVNHVGFVVEDVADATARLQAAGFHGGHCDGELIVTPYRKSAYYLDDDGNEFEFMQYLTDNLDERNFYDV